MRDKRLGRMTLQVLEHDLLRLALVIHGQDVRVEGLVLQMLDQLVVLGGKHLGVLASAVDDARNQSLATQAAARTLALICAGDCIDFEVLLHVSVLSPNKHPAPATRHDPD